MSSADLRQVALLVALIDAQSLSLAADGVMCKRSAASQSLQRLRDVFGDELVVRQGPRYLPTPLGETVLPSFRDMAALWQHTSAGTAVFDPASSEASLSLVCDASLLAGSNRAAPELVCCHKAAMSRNDGSTVSPRGVGR